MDGFAVRDSAGDITRRSYELICVNDDGNYVVRNPVLVLEEERLRNESKGLPPSPPGFSGR